MRKSPEQLEELLIKAGQEPVPALVLRKKALKKALMRRVVGRRSPYMPFVRILIPAMLVILVVFIGNGRRNGLPSEVAVFLDASKKAVAELSLEERDNLISYVGKDPEVIFSMIRKSKQVSFKNEDNLVQKEAEIQSVSMMAPTTFNNSYEDNDSQVPAVRMMMAEPSDSTQISDKSFEFIPVTFVSFIDFSGKIFVVGFDERGVPVSFVEEII